jgi:hypothetical protein
MATAETYLSHLNFLCILSGIFMLNFSIKTRSCNSPAGQNQPQKKTPNTNGNSRATLSTVFSNAKLQDMAAKIKNRMPHRSAKRLLKNFFKFLPIFYRRRVYFKKFLKKLQF